MQYFSDNKQYLLEVHGVWSYHASLTNLPLALESEMCLARTDRSIGFWWFERVVLVVAGVGFWAIVTYCYDHKSVEYITAIIVMTTNLWNV